MREVGGRRRVVGDPADPDSDPNVLVESYRRVTSKDTLDLLFAAGGGAVAVFD